MGRVGDNETQTSTVSQAQETIPENVPRHPSALPISQAPSHDKPPSNRSRGEGEIGEDDLFSIHDHQNQRPAPFPPHDNEYELPNHQAHAIPPASMHFAQPTPPPIHGERMVYPAVAQSLYVSGFTPAEVLQDKPWNSALFECMHDPGNAFITVCCPCITFGQIAEILDYGSTPCATSEMLYSLFACCFAIPCIISCTYRTKLRAKLGLIESPAPDWGVHWCCEWCALCQEYGQLKDMGYDPSIGWVEKEARMRHQLRMTPPMRQRMMM